MFKFIVSLVIAIMTLFGINVPHNLISYFVVDHERRMKEKMVFVKQLARKLLQSVVLKKKNTLKIGMIEKMILEVVLITYLLFAVVLGYDVDDHGLSKWNSGYNTLKINKLYYIYYNADSYLNWKSIQSKDDMLQKQLTHYKLQEKESSKKIKVVCDQLLSTENDKRTLEKKLIESKVKEEEHLQMAEQLQNQMVVLLHDLDSLKCELKDIKRKEEGYVDDIRKLQDELKVANNEKNVLEAESESFKIREYGYLQEISVLQDEFCLRINEKDALENSLICSKKREEENFIQANHLQHKIGAILLNSELLQSELKKSQTKEQLQCETIRKYEEQVSLLNDEKVELEEKLEVLKFFKKETTAELADLKKYIFNPSVIDTFEISDKLKKDRIDHTDEHIKEDDTMRLLYLLSNKM
ncbi:hypothetical protein HDV04_002644 [Boothiomyces sp. JEL0838]|nr:hypothetical protein HDV04_002644 [Boothiomyces sp. JEL0838]